LINDPIRAAMEQAQTDLLIVAKLLPAIDIVKTRQKETNRLANLDHVFLFQMK